MNTIPECDLVRIRVIADSAIRPREKSCKETSIKGFLYNFSNIFLDSFTLRYFCTPFFLYKPY